MPDSDGDGIVYGVPDRGDLNGPAHGTVTVDHERHTGALAGRVIYGPGKK